MEIVIILLLFVIAVLAFIVGWILSTRGQIVMSKEDLDQLITKEREDARKRSRSVLSRQFTEQLEHHISKP